MLPITGIPELDQSITVYEYVRHCVPVPLDHSLDGPLGQRSEEHGHLIPWGAFWLLRIFCPVSVVEIVDA